MSSFFEKKDHPRSWFGRENLFTTIYEW